MMLLRSVASLLCIVAALLCLPLAWADSYSDALSRAGIKTDRESLAKYLRSFQPTEAQRKLVDGLIRQLGDDEFSRREEASAAIKALPVLPRAALNKAMQSEDAEVRWRAESLLKVEEDQAQVLLMATMKVIDRQKHQGLLSEVVAAFPSITGSDCRLAARRAIAATATKEDGPQLRKLLEHENADLRVAGIMALSKALGSESMSSIKPMLRDKDDGVLLAAARAVADTGDRDSLAIYVKLLESKQPSIRWEAEASLRWLSGETMKVEETDEAKRQALIVKAWSQWVSTQGKTATLKFPIEIAPRINLFNGTDLAGWQAVVDGQKVNANTIWSAKDGILHCNGNGSGYLRTNRSFLNYEMSVDWRWPQQAPQGNFQDSGIWLMLSGADAVTPTGLEAQLGTNMAGDFWLLAGYQCKVKGQPVQGHAKKFAPSSEKPIGQWNTMTIRVQQGTVTIHVNGVEQNVATDCPKEPGCVALQVEGHAIDFRNITLLPLDD